MAAAMAMGGYAVYVWTSFALFVLMLASFVGLAVIKGVSRLLADRCDQLVKLPMEGEIESLNASVAGAIALMSGTRPCSALSFLPSPARRSLSMTFGTGSV